MDKCVSEISAAEQRPLIPHVELPQPGGLFFLGVIRDRLPKEVTHELIPNVHEESSQPQGKWEGQALKLTNLEFKGTEPRQPF